MASAPVRLQVEFLRILAERAVISEVCVQVGVAEQGDGAVKVETVLLVIAFKGRQRGKLPAPQRAAVLG